MKLSLVEKQTFYHELGRFLQSGIPLPRAAESLADDARGAMRQVLNRLVRLFLDGESVVGAFTRLRPTVGAMEVALVEASDRSGRLEQAFSYLSNYFGTLAQVRAGIVQRATWPLVQLHIGVILLNFATDMVSGAVGGTGFDFVGFVVQCAVTLGIFYAFIAAAVFGGIALTRAARANVGVDGFLALVPGIGRLRRNLSLSRFCAAYEMQLSAGVNVMDSVRAAAEASQSAGVRGAIGRMVPRITHGEAVGTLMAGESVFPAAFQRSMRTGEETGTHDADLRRWADYYQKSAVDALESAGKWLSRFVTLGILIFLGYKIVVTYSTVLQGTYGKLLE